jgi:alpha/beta superfamily hydrolase
MKIKTQDGFLLDAVFNKKDGSSGIILAHGMTVDKDDEGIFVRAEKKLNQVGFSTLRFDFRAHGDSQGDSVKDFTISGELKDLESVVDFFEDRGVDNIGLAGASFGGGIAALYAGKYPEKLKALFLANPCLDYGKCFLNPTTPWAREHFQNIFKRLNIDGHIKIGSRQFKVGKQLFEEMGCFNPCVDLRNYYGSLFMVHGDKDTKVDCQDAVDCFKSLPNKQKELEVLKGSEHGFHDEPFETDVVEMIVDFFSKSMKDKR